VVDITSKGLLFITQKSSIRNKLYNKQKNLKSIKYGCCDFKKFFVENPYEIQFFTKKIPSPASIVGATRKLQLVLIF